GGLRGHDPGGDLAGLHVGGHHRDAGQGLLLAGLLAVHAAPDPDGRRSAPASTARTVAEREAIADRPAPAEPAAAAEPLAQPATAAFADPHANPAASEAPPP